MGQLNFKGMAAVRDVTDEADVDILMKCLLTDPLKITHVISFFKQELPNASTEDKIKFEKTIKTLTNLLMNLVTLTSNVYSFNEEEVNKVIIKEPVETKVTGDPSKNLKITSVNGEDVNNNEVIPPDVDRLMREKYKAIIKQINIEGLEFSVKNLFKEGKDTEAIEQATFILSKGLYLGRKAKEWNQEAIDKFLNSCKVKVVDKETDKATTEVIAADEDLYKKYANYLNDHAPTIAGLRADTKFDLSHGNIDKAMELATFMLSNALCNDSKEEKWSNQQISNWFIEIKDDMVKNPLTIDPEPDKVIDAEKIDTSEDAEKKKQKDYEVSMLNMYDDIKDQIMNKDMSEEDIKKHIITVVTDKKVENLVNFCGGIESKDPVEATEDMYAKYFLSYVSNQFKNKAKKNIDVKEEIAKSIGKCVETKEKGLGKAIQHALGIYREKGETPTPKEVKTIVYAVAAEKYPEFYKQMMATYGKENEEKVAIIQDKIDFTKKYPEAWESIKDTNPKNLDDVFNMGRELEKSQSFPIVSAAIIHFISSGKINDKDGKLVDWKDPQIEMWINTMFTKAPTVSEAEKVVDNTIKVEPTNPIPPAEETAGKDDQTVAPVDSTKVESEVVKPKIENDQLGEDTAATKEEKSDGKAASTGDSAEATYAHLNGYAIPAEHEEFKALYAKKTSAFEQGFCDVITKMINDGKNKTNIIHDVSDVLKAIATNDAITQTFARNWRKTSMSEMYKMIDSKAKKLEIKGWPELTD